MDGGGDFGGILRLGVGAGGGHRAPGFAACEGETRRDKDAE